MVIYDATTYSRRPHMVTFMNIFIFCSQTQGRQGRREHASGTPSDDALLEGPRARRPVRLHDGVLHLPRRDQGERPEPVSLHARHTSEGGGGPDALLRLQPVRAVRSCSEPFGAVVSCSELTCRSCVVPKTTTPFDVLMRAHRRPSIPLVGPTSQPVNKPINELTTSQPTNQSINQTNTPTNQPM